MLFYTDDTQIALNYVEFKILCNISHDIHNISNLLRGHTFMTFTKNG